MEKRKEVIGLEKIFIHLFIYLSTFIAHFPRVRSKRFTFTLTLLAMLPGQH
jgi:hypothetical protein